MSKTITIEIPAPTDGWEYEDRLPKEGEEFAFLTTADGWVIANCLGRKDTSTHTAIAYAYRVRDEYAERYEALKLPDGWAWDVSGEEYWTNAVVNVESFKKVHDKTLRRIVNGKAIKP